MTQHAGQNVSTAVMQRRVEAHDSLDDFPTPPWATRALCSKVLDTDSLSSLTCWEPACNRGHMVKPLREYFRRVYASDIHDYGYRDMEAEGDFLWGGDFPPEKPDWIITNPPFRLAAQFIERGRRIAGVGVAVIVRSAFLEGVGRYKELFSKNPPTIIAQFTERVVMVKGRLEPKGSTATSYSWLVWVNGNSQTRFVWVPPCRKELERASDYAGPLFQGAGA